MNEFKRIFEKVHIRESEDSKYLNYEELTDFPYMGEDYNGEQVTINLKGTWSELNDDGSDPEDYGIDEDLAERCVLVTSYNGHSPVICAYDESGVRAFRESKDTESKGTDSSFIELDLGTDDENVANDAKKYVERNMSFKTEMIVKSEMYYLKVNTTDAANYIVSEIPLDRIGQKYGY